MMLTPSLNMPLKLLSYMRGGQIAQYYMKNLTFGPMTWQNNSKLHLNTLKGSSRGQSAKDLRSESISGTSLLSVLVVVSGSFINIAFTALIYSVDFATGGNSCH